jgi:hypothetical protein
MNLAKPGSKIVIVFHEEVPMNSAQAQRFPGAVLFCLTIGAAASASHATGHSGGWWRSRSTIACCQLCSHRSNHGARKNQPAIPP